MYTSQMFEVFSFLSVRKVIFHPEYYTRLQILKMLGDTWSIIQVLAYLVYLDRDYVQSNKHTYKP